MCPYSLTNTLIAFAVVALIGVGGPLFVLWRDNRKGQRN
jgi:hypothetical protein